jgi:hypothetical protein
MGAVPSADYWRRPLLPIMKYKAASETVNNSDVLQDDDDLVGIALGLGWWFIDMVLFISTDALADFKMQMVFSGTVMASEVLSQVWMNDTTSFWQRKRQLTELIVFPASPPVVGSPAVFRGPFEVTVGGSLKLTWAQNTADPTDTIVQLGTFLKIEPVAAP